MEAFGQGQEIHMQAAPSQAELLYKQFREKKEKLTGNTRAAIMDKYGDAASKEKPPRVCSWARRRSTSSTIAPGGW